MEFKNKTPIISKLIDILIFQFSLMSPIKKSSDTTITTTDCLLSAFAMFNLKLPSLLKFDEKFRDKENTTEAENLKNLFKIKNVPSDTYMREILDEISPKEMNNSFLKLQNYCEQKGLYKKYTFLDNYKLIAIDGTEYFNSNEIKCSHCMTRNHRNGITSYHHQALGCVMVHPDVNQVLPFLPEFICNEDGYKKNDCEINSGKRLVEKLRIDCPNLNGIIIADSLFSNAPFIDIILDKNFHYILGVKPGNHSYLFDSMLVYEKENLIQKYSIKKEEFEYHFSYINNIWLNSTGKNTVNYIQLVEIDKKGNKKLFSWVTDFIIDNNNCFEIARGGRTKWHIENQTFNTLKNQGYQFEHNFGHGKNNLCNVFAITMFLAFFVDQIQELTCQFFQSAMNTHHARYCFWEKFRAAFSYFMIKSWDLLFKISHKNAKKVDLSLLFNSS